jgi:endonuclease G, mitochondrial
MGNMKYWIGVVVVLLGGPIVGQTVLEQKTSQLSDLRAKEKELIAEIESLKLQESMRSLNAVGFPVSQKDLEIIEHSGMALGFDCDYKMAAWTFHMLTPDVTFGNISRSNDFRVDEKVSCGTAVEADYFLKKENPDGTFSYDGFGFDRGHLAPSADFRWSATALSESYYYSNMTPQRPGFNQESWAELEGLLRTIVDQEKKSFYILTGPVLNENLPVIDRSLNKLRIPELHYKIIVDLSQDTPRGMAFLMPNKKCENRLSNYVVSIDSVESLTGIDFFPSIDETLEKQIETTADFSVWKTQRTNKDVEPLNALELPKDYFNTQQAASKVGSTVSIVGKVVSAKFIPKSQSTFLNLDQSFPNQIFSIMIWKDGRRNFSYQPEKELEGKYIVVTGRVELDKNGVPGITVTKEEQIQIWEE